MHTKFSVHHLAASQEGRLKLLMKSSRAQGVHKRRPRGAQKEPKRNPRGAEEEPKEEPKRNPRGTQTEPKRSPRGAQKGAQEGAQGEPKRSSRGAQEERKRSPKGSPRGAQGGPKRRDVQETFLRCLGGYEGPLFREQPLLMAPNRARPRPAAPPGAPTRPARGMSGFWIRQVLILHNANRLVVSIRNNNKNPGHALHEKGLQRQKGIVPLVGSQEQRALLVPLINRG